MNANITRVAQTLEARFTEQKFSWAGLAKALDLKDHKILDARRRPIPGAVYDPEANNYEAIARVICGTEKAPNDDLMATFEALTEEQWSALASNARGFGGANKKYIQLAEIQERFATATAEGETVSLELWYAPEGPISITILQMTETHVAAENNHSSKLYAWRLTSFMDYAPNDEAPTEEDLTRKVREPKAKGNSKVRSFTLEDYREAAIEAVNGDEHYIEALEGATSPEEIDEVIRQAGVTVSMG